MTERTKTIKGLISGQVNMGTFGLVELELLAIEKENEALRKHAVMQRSEQLPCERCKKLEFMIDNGLGWKDMENDCT